MRWNQLTKSMIYHILLYAIIGPLSPLVILCFETKIFLTNTAFLPSKLSTLYNVFYVQQNVFWLMFVTIVTIAVRETYYEDKESDIDPFLILVISNVIVCRAATISIRHGSLSPGQRD